jgi:hypothetical protein
MLEYNKISEIYSGHYQLILDLPNKNELFKIIDLRYKYVWIIDHIENAIEWSKYKHSLFGAFMNENKINARNINMEVLIETEDFLNYIPLITQSIKIIQTNIEPPYYMNLNKLYGKSKYDLLKSKINYLYELDMPGAVDYSQIISSNKDYLERLLINLQ